MYILETSIHDKLFGKSRIRTGCIRYIQSVHAIEYSEAELTVYYIQKQLRVETTSLASLLKLDMSIQQLNPAPNVSNEFVNMKFYKITGVW